jgi:hypothetical protein
VEKINKGRRREIGKRGEDKQEKKWKRERVWVVPLLEV